MRSMAASVLLAGLSLAVPYWSAASDQPKGPQRVERSADQKDDSSAAQPAHADAQAKASTRTVSVPLYTPPLRGAPEGRLRGGSRGTGRDPLVLTVLAPDHRGLTVHEQPSLYWFVSSGTSLPVELTLTDPRAAQPVLETSIPGPVEPGMHRIRLADYGVRLAVGVVYRWYVAVVPDESRRSRDILAGGTIERVEPGEELPAKLAQAGEGDVPFLYAEAGLWYDALAAISDLIEAAPHDPALRRQRASLLAQVGLGEISNYLLL